MSLQAARIVSDFCDAKTRPIGDATRSAAEDRFSAMKRVYQAPLKPGERSVIEGVTAAVQARVVREVADRQLALANATPSIHADHSRRAGQDGRSTDRYP